MTGVVILFYVIIGFFAAENFFAWSVRNQPDMEGHMRWLCAVIVFVVWLPMLFLGLSIFYGGAIISDFYGRHVGK